MNLITADKDPNFLNRLEQRSQVVAPADALDHVVRVHAIVNASRPSAPIMDHVTGKGVDEPQVFAHPMAIEKEPGFRPSNKPQENKRPEKRFITNRKGQQIEIPAPYHYNVLEGQREYIDRRPRGIRIASDAQGNPLTFAIRPGEIAVSLRRPTRTVLDDLDDYGDDMAALNEASILRTRK